MSVARACFAVAFAAALLASLGGSAQAGQPVIHAQVFKRTGIKLTGVLWTGSRFLYIQNTRNAIFSTGPTGGRLRPFAKLPTLVEEMRCAVAPADSRFPSGDVFCHVPDNRIFELSSDGKHVKLFASLPTKTTSDGALAFDTVGRFGHLLVAATGRSGAAQAAGGTVYTIDPAGAVHEVGSYPGPGGADELAIAPSNFRQTAGWALLTVDAGSSGSVVAVGPQGQTRTIARLPDGPNPIAVVSATDAAGAAAPGFYVSDTNTKDVYRIAASRLAPYAGDVQVGTEVKAELWVIRPKAHGYVTRQLRSDLPPPPAGKTYNLEGADDVP
jgi:hypothetical protein